jgi:hypothetical protein
LCYSTFAEGLSEYSAKIIEFLIQRTLSPSLSNTDIKFRLSDAQDAIRVSRAKDIEKIINMMNKKAQESCEQVIALIERLIAESLTDNHRAKSLLEQNKKYQRD